MREQRANDKAYILAGIVFQLHRKTTQQREGYTRGVRPEQISRGNERKGREGEKGGSTATSRMQANRFDDAVDQCNQRKKSENRLS